jgi:hypothetical protein
MTIENNQFLEQLSNYFEQQNKQQETLVQAGNKHVFQACMEHLEGRLNFEEKMTLMDYHLCYNNALNGARENNLEASQRWLNKAAELPDFENPSLQKIVDVNKFPAIAYHLYRAGDHEKAIQLLMDTIQISGSLAQEDNIEYMVWGQMEDYINIFRVHCTQKDSTSAFKYARSILLASVLGKHSKGVLENVSATILKKAEIDFISYATSDTLLRLLRLEPSKRKVVAQVFSPLWEIQDWSSCPLSGYQNAIFALKYWVEEDTTSFLKEFESLLPNMNRQSYLLQFYLLEAIIPLIEASSNATLKETILSHLSNYYINQLDLDYSILKDYSQLKIEVASN